MYEYDGGTQPGAAVVVPDYLHPPAYAARGFAVQTRLADEPNAVPRNYPVAPTFSCLIQLILESQGHLAPKSGAGPHEKEEPCFHSMRSK
jgi:hypothetical protein